ncbi:MAG: LuxR C-terminal-related transcriptional regulator [Ulvibacter sp.]|nr:LuxR C-terminal-related transcriptional regulator [Ulvibacter sp.]|tara:strand:- start:3556 stop:5487 length:1932 start_codon:yes stop_codon:yes gene_type:complete
MIKHIWFILFLLTGILQAQNDQDQTPDIKVEDIKNQLQTKDLPSTTRIDNLLIVGKDFITKSEDSARYYLEKALQLSKIEKDSFNIIRAYNRFSVLEKYLENDLNTLKYADSALEYGSSANQKHFAGIAYAHSNKGLAYNYLERFDLSLESFLNANSFLLKDDQDTQIKTYLAENYTHLAKIYSSIKNNETALECIKKSLTISKAIDAYWETGESYEFMFAHYFDEKQYTLAQKYIDSAQTMYAKAENVQGIQFLAKYRAEIYLKQNKPDLAIPIYDALLQLDKKDGVAYILTEGYTFLSKAYTNKNKFKLAAKYLDSARVQASISENLSHRISIASQQAKIYKSRKQLSRGILELQTILKNENIDFFQESKKDLYKELSELYALNNDPKNALLSSNEHYRIKDSLRAILQKNKFNVIQSEFNYNELSAKLKARDAQLQVSKTEQKRARDNTYFSFGVLSLIVLFFLISFYRQKKLNTVKRENLMAKQEVLSVKQEALDTQVAFKNKQITDFAIHISEKNELLEKIKIKLKQVKVINDTHKAVVNDTIHFINNDIDQNREKIQLYQQVNQTNDSFRAKIEQLYTNLNDKEKKVATMLRLGQPSKQIALQLGISAASVDNYRYNLRKKMEIPKGHSLKDFINKI